MIARINTALLELQGALLARALYPREHPRIRRGEERAFALLQQILADRPELDVFGVDNRVICDNRILPGSPNLSKTLFRALRLSGFDRLSFRRGLGPRELQEFLDTLCSGLAKQGQRLEASEHLGFGSLQDLDAEAYQSSADAADTAVSSAAAMTLAEAWDQVEESPHGSVGTLKDIVSSLSRVVSRSSGAMLPLAPLKQHDEYTFVHTINVALLSTALAEALGFDNRAVYDLTIAALLHDVGKRAIPPEIINKAGRFTDDEFRIMQAHTVEGARILLNMPNVPDIAPVVAFEHHIRANGGGYPRVPRGWRLNLASRIVQVADVFDALRTDRPYRPGQPVTKIVEIMSADVGTFFDADLLLVFLQEVVSRGVPGGLPAVPAAVD